MERKYEIDFTRVISAIAVIIIHITAGFIFAYQSASLHQKLVITINRTVLFAVPSFVLLSGLSLSLADRNKKTTIRGYLEFVLKRFKTVLIPYFLWSAFYYSIYVVKGTYPLDIKNILEGLLYGNIMYHLYFIIIIVQMYVVYKPIKWCANRVHWSVGIVLSLLFYYFGVKYLNTIGVRYIDRIFVSYIQYFVIGIYLAKHYKKIEENYKKIFIPMVVLTAGVLVYNIYIYISLYSYNIINSKYHNGTWVGYSVLATLVILMMGMKILNKKENLKPIFKRISGETFFIYFSHPFLLILITYIMDRAGINSISFRLMMTVLFVFMVYGIYLMRKLKYMKD